MKKSIVLIALLIALSASLQAQWINNTDNTSFNFIAPDGATATKNEVLFPFSEVTTYSTTNDTLTLTVEQQFTVYSTTDTLDANTYFYLTIDAQITAGAQLLLLCKSGAVARSFIPKTGFIGTTATGTINKSKYLQFIYNGTAFIHVGTMQID